MRLVNSGRRAETKVCVKYYNSLKKLLKISKLGVWMNVKWSATFDDARLLRQLVSSLSAILNTANLNVSDKQMKISGMDESRIAMASLKAPNSFFQEYEYAPSEEDEKVGLNVQKLKDVLRRARSEDGVTLDIDSSEANQFEIKFFRGIPEERQFERIFSIPLPEEAEEVNPEGLDYKVTLEFAPPDTLSAIISDAAVFAEDLKIEAKQNDKQIRFVAESGIGSEYEYVANLDTEEAIISYELKEDATSLYSLDFLGDFTNVDRVAEMVRLEFAQENPLRLTYNITGGCTVTFLLAPRVV